MNEIKQNIKKIISLFFVVVVEILQTTTKKRLERKKTFLINEPQISNSIFEIEQI